MKFCKLLLCLLFVTASIGQFASAQSDSVQIKEKDDVSISPEKKKNTKKNEVFITGSISDSVTTVHTTDSILRKKHSPGLAVGLSAVIPGAGQIYNKKWWKVPIIYAGLGTSIYLTCRFAKKMNTYKYEYRYRMDGTLDKLDPALSGKSDENILSLKKQYQRYMEISIAATGIIYVLNLIDAVVDAHLFYFDISDDLSLKLSPYVQPTPFEHIGGGGIAMTFNLK